MRRIRTTVEWEIPDVNPPLDDDELRLCGELVGGGIPLNVEIAGRPYAVIVRPVRDPATKQRQAPQVEIVG